MDDQFVLRLSRLILPLLLTSGGPLMVHSHKLSPFKVTLHPVPRFFTFLTNFFFSLFVATSLSLRSYLLIFCLAIGKEARPVSDWENFSIFKKYKVNSTWLSGTRPAGAKLFAVNGSVLILSRKIKVIRFCWDSSSSANPATLFFCLIGFKEEELEVWVLKTPGLETL